MKTGCIVFILLWKSCQGLETSKAVAIGLGLGTLPAVFLIAFLLSEIFNRCCYGETGLTGRAIDRCCCFKFTHNPSFKREIECVCYESLDDNEIV